MGKAPIWLFDFVLVLGVCSSHDRPPNSSILYLVLVPGSSKAYMSLMTNSIRSNDPDLIKSRRRKNIVVVLLLLAFIGLVYLVSISQMLRHWTAT